MNRPPTGVQRQSAEAALPPRVTPYDVSPACPRVVGQRPVWEVRRICFRRLPIDRNGGSAAT